MPTFPTIQNLDPSSASGLRFCRLFLGITLSLFTVIATTNFVVNPYAQYAPSGFQPMVQTSRTQKVDLLANSSPVPEGLVLGSSRVLKFEPDYLEQRTGYRFFNAGINYGKTEDFLAFLRYYHDTFDRMPKAVVVGLDVTAFTDGSRPDARLLNNTTLACRVPEAINLSDRMHRWCELLSWQQTKTSLKSLKIHATSETPPKPAKSFRDDGLLVYHQRDRELTEGTSNFTSALEYNKSEYKQLFRAFKKMSEERCEVFEKLASICRTEDIRLTVFLTPMHPELTAHLADGTEYQDRKATVLQYLKNQRAEYHFALWDMSSLNSFSGDPVMFVDGIHPLEANTRRIIDRIFNPQPRTAEYAIQ